MLEIPISAGAVRMVDPHLVVLGVLVGAWVLDRVLAALEWLRGTPAGGGGRSSSPSGPE